MAALAANQDILNLNYSLEILFGENTLKCLIHKHKKALTQLTQTEFISGEKAWM